MEDRASRMVRLLEYINDQDRPVPISELIGMGMTEFGVSEVTLRSDLTALCALAGIRKLARGTYAARPSDPLQPGRSLFATRLQRRAESKIAIARAVARELTCQPDLRVLLLDAGTTTYYVADQLSEQNGLDLIVWTPSVAAAYALAGARGVSVRLLGGEFQPDYAAVSGDETARALRALAGSEAENRPLDEPLPQFRGTHCVLDVNHVTGDGRLFTDESQERLQKRLMAELAEDLTLVADHSKLFRNRLGLQAHEVHSLGQFRGKRSIRVVSDSEVDRTQQDGLCRMLEAAFPTAEVTLRESEGAVVCQAVLGPSASRAEQV